MPQPSTIGYKSLYGTVPQRGIAAMASWSSPLPKIIALVLIAALLLFALSRIAGCVSGAISGIAGPAQVSTETVFEATDFNLTPASFDLMPEMSTSDGIVSFSLSDLSAPEVPAFDELRIVSRIIGIENDREARAGFVFVDTETGRGIAYNAEDKIYGASTFKAPYATYVCETHVEDGDVTLSTPCRLSTSVDRGSYYKAGRSYAVQDLIDAAVTWSDNNAFGGLRTNFDMRGFDDWAGSLGANDVKYDDSSWFPTYCPRTSAKLWSEVNNYVSSGTETAAWLGELLGDTEVSFIRNGITGETKETTASGLVEVEGDGEESGESSSDAEGASSQAGVEGDITFMNKAGWSPDEDPAYRSVSDAGLVTLDGRTYLLCIMTDMRDSEASRRYFEDLARTIFDAREALDYQWVEQAQEA
ncbi:serine hydrolase [Adlercreutzia sp. ZJ242]|uniref:serine hydrolase n=1 Tax=Adlercreutzia sp. ZJ242 TaxID=2709409 RepID=UPI0013ECFB65|nr:serine hydrolase [Adlercreutzia sp. ZJ242]